MPQEPPGSPPGGTQGTPKGGPGGPTGPREALRGAPRRPKTPPDGPRERKSKKLKRKIRVLREVPETSAMAIRMRGRPPPKSIQNRSKIDPKWPAEPFDRPFRTTLVSSGPSSGHFEPFGRSGVAPEADRGAKSIEQRRSEPPNVRARSRSPLNPDRVFRGQILFYNI